MQTVTKISTSKRHPHRRQVYLDGKLALACNVTVVARYRLREGMTVTEEKLREIEQGEIRQNCMDRAMRFIESRLHSRVELQRKLRRAEFSVQLIEQVLDELTRLGVVDDQRFSRARLSLVMGQKRHGRRRALTDLLQRGVSRKTAEQTIGQTYSAGADATNARALAEKHAARLGRLDPIVARRRLTGLLSRRGFDYEQVRDAIDRVLGPQREEVSEST
jgi:regulatory protein